MTAPAPESTAAPTSNELAQQRTTLAGDRTHLADERTALALDRTRLAHERTLMAWIRTAMSLISFGFTIYKFFQGLADTEKIQAAHRLFGPRGFALIMIGLGVGSLVLAIIQNRAEMKKLKAEYAQYGAPPVSTSLVIGSIVGVLGVMALILVILRQ
jgi:putative membrane protein